MATTKLAFGSILDSVVKASNAIGTTFGTAANAINMADRYVTKVSAEQELRYRGSKRQFVKELVAEQAQTDAQRKLQINDFCNQSDAHRSYYESSYNEFAELYAPELGITTDTETPE